MTKFQLIDYSFMTYYYQSCNLFVDLSFVQQYSYQKNLYLITYNQGQNLVYENLSFQLDTKNYKIDPDVVFDRVVVNKRGGICFDLLELLYRALTYLGYDVKRMLCEVCASKNPNYSLFSHEAYLVTIDNEYYFVDFGFGFNCPRYPLKVRFDQTNEVTILYGETYQLECTEELFRLNLKTENGWVGMFEFLKDQQTGLPKFTNTEEFKENFNEFIYTKKPCRIRDNLVQFGRLTLHGRIGYICFRQLKTMERVEFMFGVKVSSKKYDDPSEFIKDAQREFNIPLDVDKFLELFATPPYLGEQ